MNEATNTIEHNPAEGSHVEGGVVEHPDAKDFGNAAALPADPTWFKHAVFYEVLVRAFYDGTADGSGDLRGLMQRLDYLQRLGIDCIWSPPFYDSPLRDGGYDIRDFYKVLPEFGTVGDFVALVDAAHRRGIRVITDLVMNHTSESHPWFQESRHDPDGPLRGLLRLERQQREIHRRPDHFRGHRRVQLDFRSRAPPVLLAPVFSHQPDLNYDNPAVQEAMIDVLRFWLGLGIDGFRLDAVPYLFEREGTNCENLPETHAFLKRVRKVVDDEFPGRVLLAEANQWPADVVEYFGEASTGGDECHMAFHFPLMPRIFMAVRRESRFPISEILAKTPPIPDMAQWGIFLRNHDELTLEMVTDEERDYMYAEYAKDPRMKANVGIRRRLAPLLENDRNQIQLFNALLLSLPGSPVLYYGDEIGMGDVIWLGDRDGVRTPMQWTPDRNAGFSTANPGRLYLPPSQDSVYGYQAVNVEAQRDTSTSLLNWTRTMLAVRRRHNAFAVGTFQELGGSSPSILAYVREAPGPAGEDGDVVLCVNNLSRFPQPIELNLQQWNSYTPVELTGQVEFPKIGHLPYLLTLPGHGFYWFQLSASEEER
ncbi:maltose alpha-D-glucosyltransferase [Mycobacterium ulcerans]|uniref:maltose alpha-D-glucosyltransferase n=1 Tax=Mycobacterium ulcerans TaxID=1809 RepID=UPI001FFC8DD7|nr:maltose alpha-D-glucosyltransferase [Mycobacterium ulcerans]